MPHELVNEYEIVSTPSMFPVTIPPVVIETKLLNTLQVPPEFVSEYVTMEPIHTSVSPVIDPALKGFIVTTNVENVVPHELEKEYFMVSTPGKTPVTIQPVEIGSKEE